MYIQTLLTSGFFWDCYVNERGWARGKCFLPKPSSQLINSPPILSPSHDLLICTDASLFHLCITIVLDSTHISASSIFLAFSYHSSLASRWLLSRPFIDTSHPQTQGASANEIQHVSRCSGNQDACKYAIHKATGKRNVAMLVNLQNLLLTLDSLGEE